MTAAEFASRIEGARPSGGGFTGRCPAHEDRRASLSFRDGERGVLVTCFAGCSLEAIAGALGLRVADLFHDGDTKRPHGHAPREVAVYDYTDEAGTLLFQVVRLEPKTFRQRRPDGRGGFTWNLNGVRRVLYRLPALRGQAVVYLVEGEKDANRLVALGIPATTNPGGVGKWIEDYAAQLVAAGAQRVVILPDNDPPGEAHAVAVARSCLAAGLTVKIVRLPGLPPKGDLSDWLEAGRSKDGLAALVKATPPATPESLRGPTPDGGLPLTALGDLLNEPEEACAFLVEGRLPAGGLSILAGKPKGGKSTLARCLALAVARGGPWLGFSTRQGSVFYLALEEKRAEVRRHFEAMRARPDDAIDVFIAPSPKDGLVQLREAADRRRPVLIIVDPLLKLVRVKDANDYAAVSQALEPLLTLARETGAHVLAVHHTGKGERSGGDAILGSTAIFAAVDTALILKRGDKYRTLSSIQRYGEDLEEVTLTLDPETREVSAGAPRREVDEAEAERLILEYLRGQGEPVEERPILGAVEGKNAVKVRALRHLLETGRVARTGAGRRGDPYRYAVSTTLLPVYSRVVENENPKTPVSTDDERELGI